MEKSSFHHKWNSLRVSQYFTMSNYRCCVGLCNQSSFTITMSIMIIIVMMITMMLIIMKMKLTTKITIMDVAVGHPETVLRCRRLKARDILCRHYSRGVLLNINQKSVHMPGTYRYRSMLLSLKEDLRRLGVLSRGQTTILEEIWECFVGKMVIAFRAQQH